MGVSQAAQNIDFREARGALEGAGSRLRVVEGAVAATEAAALEATSLGSTSNQHRRLALSRVPHSMGPACTGLTLILLSADLDELCCGVATDSATAIAGCPTSP